MNVSRVRFIQRRLFSTNYFSDGSTPKTFQQLHSDPQLNTSRSSSSSSSKIVPLLRWTCMVLLSVTLFENYKRTWELEQKLETQQQGYKRNISQLQANFKSFQKKQSSTYSSLKKTNNEREVKMALHIGILRQQLIKNGIEPSGIDEALREFENKVRITVDPSLNYIWLEDESALKPYTPDIHDYDKRKN
ncbi:Hypothetical protein PP7435_CHR1-1517 [Komagataella phaffii CBS 7435]|uniref:Uncharacterized protein n=2 Tax=Komagataella phaffii TaxID=460519 RepID=C4QZ91_KOMPG|nr:Hypothetical protein PAS_FragB_0035 [Komagataella phaffii GS115]AOA60340.1 GQ67_01428T0 [Komagataella phaffii]CAH2447396.1 Hypothetical protein BQ9382_C1-7910 [Komagataella phaffii CBS 7435]AOA66505.1 GQ68_01444T0 [Komagataella phaffii GS115]CAY68565.1 Hypothetical protein PAS_FragB_0035 [Komagataella phaffii GS115]CCA37628.1 Hypothetical protein PP7435_CHR1-1517 [Komagataella phaffii CBS 7435]